MLHMFAPITIAASALVGPWPLERAMILSQTRGLWPTSSVSRALATTKTPPSPQRQTNTLLPSDTYHNAPSVLSVLKQAYASDGILGLYKGSLLRFIRWFLSNPVLRLITRPVVRTLFDPRRGRELGFARITLDLYALALAKAIPTALVLLPIDVAVTALAADVGADCQYPGVISFVRKTWAKDGVFGFLRAVDGALISELSHQLIMTMGISPVLTSLIPQGNWVIAMIGSNLLALIPLILYYPFETVYRRQVLTETLTNQRSSFYVTARDLYRHAGIVGFFDGVLINVLLQHIRGVLTLTLHSLLRVFVPAPMNPRRRIPK